MIKELSKRKHEEDLKVINHNSPRHCWKTELSDIAVDFYYYGRGGRERKERREYYESDLALKGDIRLFGQFVNPYNPEKTAFSDEHLEEYLRRLCEIRNKTYKVHKCQTKPKPEEKEILSNMLTKQKIRVCVGGNDVKWDLLRTYPEVLMTYNQFPPPISLIREEKHYFLEVILAGHGKNRNEAELSLYSARPELAWNIIGQEFLADEELIQTQRLRLAEGSIREDFLELEKLEGKKYLALNNPQ